MSAKKQINIQELIRSKSKKVRDTSGHEARVIEDVYALKIAKECACFFCVFCAFLRLYQY